MGQALYRKYRSKSLDEIVGQSHITQILQRAIKRDQVAHAYLLTGPRGVGKTSIARILAHEINHIPYTDESTHLDIIEIDAASNNSVEDIRDLRERVQIAPTSAPKKIYIIDEVHMLSKSAFNALLKTLEEPPAHVVFILATTDADKLPATILSRVQRFNFRLISEKDVATHLRFIADNEAIDVDDTALKLIARQGRGSFRDSISLLDQLQHVSDTTVTTTLIEESLGLASENVLNDLLSANLTGNLAGIVQSLDELELQGVPAPIIADQLTHLIQQNAISAPSQLALLDPLLHVARSPWPYVSLLSALAPKISQPTNMPAPNDLPPKKPAKSTPKNSPENNTKITTKNPEQTPKSSVITPKNTPKKTANKQATSQPFNWEKFLDPLKQSAAGAYSILSKCGHDFDNETLTIYAGKKFAKSQIDKALPALAQSLQSMNCDAEIVVLATTRPPESSEAAAIIAMMGGGEEVSL